MSASKRPSVPPQSFDGLNRHFTDVVVTSLASAEAESAVLVEAPPGAGKSTLTCSVAHHLVTVDERMTLPIITQTNEQADDIVVALNSRFPQLDVGRLTSQAGPGPMVGLLSVSTRTVHIGTRCDEGPMLRARVIVGTARKWEYERARLGGQGARFPMGLIDEAYQMRSDALLGIATLFETLMCVGDPGQLDPFTQIDDTVWRGLPYSPSRSAMAVLRDHHDYLEPIRLPTSWRLPPSAAGIVSRAFYPYTPFEPGTTESQRRLYLNRPPRASVADVESALEAAATSGWAYLELPERFTVRTDDEIAGRLASIVTQALLRGGTVVDERAPEGRTLAGNRIAVIAAHNDQVQAVRYQLHSQGTDPDQVVVSTANKIQGREYDLVAVWHPLAGCRDASAFHLEAGRMCVMLSRHRQACVVVGRAGADRLLSEFPDSDPVFLDEPEKFPDGWQANYEVLEHLRDYRVSAAG